MAAVQEAVRRLSIQATTSGVTKATAELKGLANAQGDVAVASEKTERATLSLDQKFASTERRLVATVRAQQEYDRVQRQVNAAVAQNPALSERANVVLAAAAERFRVVTGTANDNAKAVGLARHELVNLGRQAQDVGTMLAMGASPMQVFTSQFAQVFDIFSSSRGTVNGFFSQMVSGLTSIVTPARVAFGGIAAGAVAAAVAVNSYLTAQQQVSMALTGSGRASGANMASINATATAGASTFGLSVSEARQLASELAATGKIANDNLLPIVKIGKDIANAFGIDAADAAKMLATAFADPVKGADALNARLGFLDAAMRREIESLVAQNRVWDAQRALLSGVLTGLAGVDDAVSKTSRGWSAIGNVVSNAWDKIGGAMARVLNLETLDPAAQLERVNARIADLQARQAAPRSSLSGSPYAGPLGLSRRGEESDAIAAEIERETASRQKLIAEIARQAEITARAQAAQKSFDQAAALRDLSPEVAQRQALNDQLKLMEGLLQDIARDPAIAERFEKLGYSLDVIRQSAEKAKSGLDDFKTSFERSQQAQGFQLRSLTAFSPQDRGQLAYEQRYAQELERTKDTAKAAALAEGDRVYAIKAARVAMSESARERVLAAEQSKASAELELGLVGKGIAAQTEARLNLQAKHQLEQEAARNRTGFDEAQYERLKKLNAEQAKLNELRAVKDLEGRVQFERDTMFMSPTEQAIAREMKNIYDDKWQSNMDSAVAKQMRMNDILREGRDVVSGFGADLLGGLLRGEDAFKSLTTAASNLIQKLASANLNRFLNGGSLFGNQSLMSGAGLVGMAGAGLAGYQSGSPLTGALGGALAGASFGPIGMAAGGLIGAISGLFGGNSQRREQERQRAAQLAQERAQLQSSFDDRTRNAQWSRIDTSTLDGALNQFDQRAAFERQQAALKGGEVLASAERALAEERLNIVTDFAKREADLLRQREEATAQRRRDINDQIFDLTNDTTTVSGKLAAIEREYQRAREDAVTSGLNTLADEERLYYAKRNKAIEDANNAALDEQRRTAEEAIKYLQNVAKTVRQFLDQLSTGQSSVLSPMARLGEAQAQFNQQLALALSGDRDALGGVTDYAGRLIEQAKSVYGSTEAYANIYNAVVAGLGQVEGMTALPANDNVVAAINATTQAVTSQNPLLSTANALSATLNSLIATLNSLTESNLSIAQSSRDHLNLMKAQLTGTFTQLTYSWSGGIGHAAQTTFTVNNNLLDAMNKIVGNTHAIAANTASISAILGNQYNRGYTAAQGILADGGRIGGLPHSMGGTLIEAERDEFMIRRSSAQRIGYDTLDYINRTGILPTRVMLSSNDNGANDNRQLMAGLARTIAAGDNAVVAELRALREEIAGLKSDGRPTPMIQQPGRRSVR